MKLNIKTYFMKKIFFFCSTFLVALSLVIVSCQKNEAEDTEAAAELKCGSVTTTFDTISVPENVCGDVKVVQLVAGRHNNVGTIEIINDETTLYVTYKTTSYWSLVEAHLYVGDIELMPNNKAHNPVPGHFPYSVNRLPFNTTKYTFAIPLEGLPTCPEILAHAVVRRGWQIETAWIRDLDIASACGAKHWGGFTSYCIQECPLVCNYYKAWVTGVQRTTIPFQGYYNNYLPGGEPVVAEIVDFRSHKPASAIGTITYTDDTTNLIVNIAMNQGFYASEYYSYFGSNAGLTPYITTINGVNVLGLPIHEVLSSRVSNYTYTVPLSEISKNDDGSLILVQFMYFCEPVVE